MATISPVTRRYKRALGLLRTQSAQSIGRGFAALGTYDQASSTRFIAAAVPAVVAAQSHASALSSAYLGQILTAKLGDPVPLSGVDPADVTGAAVRGGVEPGDVYRRSFVALWVALDAGATLGQALALSKARIEQAVQTDVALAARATSRDILSKEGRVSGYQRAVDPGACDLCSGADGVIYRTDDLMPIHPGCGCVAEPVVGEEPSPPSDEGDAVIEVVDHGELGPLLWPKGDDFHPDEGA